MFRRLVFENTAALFTLVAFITAVSIYLSISWRALRMKGSQVSRFAHLPFDTETPESMAPQDRAGRARTPLRAAAVLERASRRGRDSAPYRSEKPSPSQSTKVSREKKPPSHEA